MLLCDAVRLTKLSSETEHIPYDGSTACDKGEQLTRYAIGSGRRALEATRRPSAWINVRNLFLILVVLSGPAIATIGSKGDTEQYHLYKAKFSSKDFPSVFDGKQVRMVKVMNIKDADTEANRKACATVWRGIRAYRQLCLNLGDHRILDVEVLQYPASISMQVPVVRIAKVKIGQHGLVRMPEILPTEVVKSLPAFVGMLSDSDLRQAL